MNILLISQYSWPESFRINDVVRGLVGRGHGVTVLTGMPNYPQGRLMPGYGLSGPYAQTHEGARIFRVPLVPRGRGGGLRLALNYLSFALAASLVAPLRLPRDLDVVFVFEPSPITVGLPALLVRFLRRRRIVFWVQDLWPESLVAAGAVRSPRLLRWVGRLARFIYSRCDKILVQSRGFMAPIVAMGVDSGKLVYLPNSAEPFYRPIPREDCAAEDRELPQGFRVVFAGNIGAAQDFPTVLDAASRTRHVPQLRWIIIGDGRMHAWLVDEIARRSLGATVHVVGGRPPEAMPRYFAVSDVLLATLKRDAIFALTIPSKLQSYLACGRPVLAALDGEGARVVSEAGAGLAGPAEDGAALADNALRLHAATVEQRDQMGAAARAYFADHFERERFLDRLESVLRQNSADARP